MTTVLRGKSLKDYENYLTKNGTRSIFPSENWVAVNDWLQELIPHYPRTDNEPLQWIKEMIKVDPTARRTAEDLRAQISQAMNGVWCGRCCNGDDSTESITTSEYESQHEDLPDVLNEDLQPTVAPQQPYDPLEASRPTPASVLPTEQLVPIKTQSVLETPFSPGETMGQRMMDTFLNSLGEAETPTPAEIHGVNIPLSTPKQHATQLHHNHIGHHEHSKYPEGATSLFGKVKELLTGVAGPSPIREDASQAKSRLGPEGIRGNLHEGRKLNSTIQDSALGAFVSAEAGDIAPAIIAISLLGNGLAQTNTHEGQDRISRENEVSKEPPTIPEKLQKLADKNIIPETILETWKGWAQPVSCETPKDESDTGQRTLARTRSYEDLGRQTESILETPVFGAQDSDRRASDDFSLAEYSKVKLVYFENIKQELKDFNPPVTWSIPFVPVVGTESVEQAGTKNQTLQSPTVAIEEVLPTDETPPPAYTPTEVKSTESFTRNALKDSLNQARGKAPATKSASLLTAQNLCSLNAEPTRPKRVKVDLQTASVYMKKIQDDAASSVATSVMSTRTRERFKLAGLMLPLQDRSCRYLEQYCKEGKADAVRLLLQSGCEPGTTKRRRPGPIFNAVRGASMRHIKCVDALIAKGVNVNVKSQSNGRTPLHYAIEQQPWPGYMRLIYTLLKAGANPNIQDATGDVPLLQILYGGIEPLAEHKRDALALLLTTNFNTDLTISPPATKNTPLHLAVTHQDPWAVALLLNREVPVNKKNVADLTPLQLSAGSWKNPLSEDQMEILELLLERNAKVNVKDGGTWQTPVHTAVLLELDQVLTKLIASGGDISQKDISGRSALDLFEDQKSRHNAGNKVCKKCVKVQHVINKTMFRGASALAEEKDTGNSFQKHHNVLFSTGISIPV